MFKLLDINENSPKPIYVQIQDCIINGIKADYLSPGSQLPSINEVSDALNIARKTAEKAYNDLKRKSIIVSVPGKGFFVADNNKLDQKKVLLMFDIMNTQNNHIHRAFMEAFKDHNMVDFLVYHKDFEIFKRYITSTPDEYSHYVIMGHFLENESEAVGLINQIPKHKLIILDRELTGLYGDYSSITQDFGNIIYQALNELENAISHYQKLCILFPKHTYYPEETLNGPLKFASDKNMSFEVVTDIKQYRPNRGDLFLTLTESGLTQVMINIQDQQLFAGSDVGIISYTDSPLNSILSGGITTISPNFKIMGELAANSILGSDKVNSTIGYNVIQRNSL